MPSIFNTQVKEEYNYLLLGVYINETFHTATYYKGCEGEYITSLLTCEKFYNLWDFAFSVLGLGCYDEWQTVFYYDPDKEIKWIPLYFLR